MSLALTAELEDRGGWPPRRPRSPAVDERHIGVPALAGAARSGQAGTFGSMRCSDDTDWAADATRKKRRTPSATIT